AAVKLTPMDSNQAVRFVYVHANERWTIEGVQQGTYRLRFTQGSDWNYSAKVFRRNASYQQFDRPVEYVERPTATGIQYDVREVTLHRVPSGNAATRSLRPHDF